MAVGDQRVSFLLQCGPCSHAPVHRALPPVLIACLMGLSWLLKKWHEVSVCGVSKDYWSGEQRGGGSHDVSKYVGGRQEIPKAKKIKNFNPSLKQI